MTISILFKKLFFLDRRREARLSLDARMKDALLYEH